MSQQQPRLMGGGSREPITLNFPQSLRTFDKYADAQGCVDKLSDEGFPVENCMIVGTELRQVERVLGRLTQGRVAMAGAASGGWFGLFIGLIFGMFNSDAGVLPTVVSCFLFGVLFGLVWAMIGYSMTRGRRDFTSVTQVVATKYEVLVEHKVLAQAQQILGPDPTNW